MASLRDTTNTWLAQLVYGFAWLAFSFPVLDPVDEVRGLIFRIIRVCTRGDFL